MIRGWAKRILEWTLGPGPLGMLHAHRMRGKCLILAYHNVVPTGQPPRGDRSLHLDFSLFRRQLDWLAGVDVVALEDAVIDLKSLHRLLGASGRFSFGSADLMRETLGVEPGSVTPFGLINDTQSRLNVVLDAAMMAQALLNYHPLINSMTTTIARDDLLRFLEATGHKPRILAVSQAG